jgi:hypothetical protein
MGASAMQPPTGNPGESANAMSVVREALEKLQSALPKLPAGSDPWKAVLSAIQGIGKHVSPSDAIPGVQKTTQGNLQQQAQQSAAMQALNRAMGSTGSPGGAGQPGGGGTGLPGPAAAAAGMPPSLAMAA